MATGRQ